MTDSSRPSSGARFTLAPAQGVWRVGSVALTVSLVMLVAVLEQGQSLPLEGVLLIFGVGFMPFLAFLAMGRPSGQQILEVLDDRLHVPYGPRFEQTVVLRYPELTTVYRRRGPRGFLLIATPYAQMKFSRKSFSSDDDFERAYGAIRARLENFLPAGEVIAARMDEANAAADRVADAKPVITVALVVVLVAVYAALRLGGAFDRIYAIVGYGAGIEPLVGAGQFFRVATASWIHGNALHLAAVVFVIFQFGSRVERLFGPVNTLLVAVLAALAGGAASALSATTPVFFGAQTIAFGLFGAYAFVATRYKANLPLGMRRRLVWWIFVSLMLAAVPMLSGAVDLPGELGGLLVGVVASALLFVRDDPPLPQPKASVPAIVLSAASVVATLAGVVMFAQHGERVADETTMIRYHLDNSLGGRVGLNRIAWEVATDPSSDGERLGLARTAIERALERERDDDVRAAFEDTYATVLHRLGERDAAVEHELEALKLTDGAFMATQLARFADGATVVLGGTRDRDVRLEVVEHEMRGFGVRVWAASATTSTSLYAIARLDDRIVGLLRMSLSPTVDRDVTRWLAKEGAAASWPSGISLAPAVYVPLGSSWRAWSADPDALALP